MVTCRMFVVLWYGEMAEGECTALLIVYLSTALSLKLTELIPIYVKHAKKLVFKVHLL